MTPIGTIPTVSFQQNLVIDAIYTLRHTADISPFLAAVSAIPSSSQLTDPRPEPPRQLETAGAAIAAAAASGGKLCYYADSNPVPALTVSPVSTLNLIIRVHTSDQ